MTTALRQRLLQLADAWDTRAFLYITTLRGKFIDAQGREWKEGDYACNTIQSLARELRALADFDAHNKGKS
jgi:hypothetical protein